MIRLIARHRNRTLTFLEYLPYMLGEYRFWMRGKRTLEKMDEAAAMEAKKEAMQALHNTSGELDYSRAAVQLAEAAAQLRTLQAIRKKMGK